MTESRPPIPDNLEDVEWPALQTLAAAYGLRGKKSTILRGLRAAAESGAEAEAVAELGPAEAPRPPKPLGVEVGEIVAYYDRVNGQEFDARVSLIVSEEDHLVNLQVFSGSGAPRLNRAVPKGMSRGSWWPRGAK